ncbi:isocitrate/isopropylmalate dehydrogenase family protein [Candidatus Poribacteria bacterium]|nr:isocitrate/isopropylmalate dehydrogenase family protein [Candidatus Poribacteria bacterium]
MRSSTKTITLIPGDGIGPEISEVVRRCISALGVAIDWDIQQAGASVIEKEKSPLPDRVLDSIRNNTIALKGPVETPVGKGFRSINVELRQKLDLYACVRPTKYYEGVRSRISNPQAIDIVVVRENTEDLYAGIEFMESCGVDNPLLDFLKEQKGVELGCDTGISIKPISVKGSERIVTFAFEYARKYKRRKVTAIDKANIMKYTDGLFMNVAAQVSRRYKDIAYEHILVDNMCMQLVQLPEKYDVLVLPNLYGDIISDLVAGLVGGLGVAPGVNMGDKFAVFEATHGSAPDIAGQDKANPTGMLLSAVLMLEHIGESMAARRLEGAVAEVLREGRHVTSDLQREASPYPSVGTSHMGDAIIERINKGK